MTFDPAYLKQDPRTGVPFVHLPEPYGRSLPDIIVHWFSRVDKVNARGTVDIRLSMVTDECIYMMTPDEDPGITRCVLIKDIQTIIIQQDWINFLVPTEYDLRFKPHIETTVGPKSLQELAQMIRRLHHYRTKGDLVVTNMEHPEMVLTQLRLRKPEGWVLNIHNLKTRSALAKALAKHPELWNSATMTPSKPLDYIQSSPPASPGLTYMPPPALSSPTVKPEQRNTSPPSVPLPSSIQPSPRIVLETSPNTSFNNSSFTLPKHPADEEMSLYLKERLESLTREHDLAQSRIKLLEEQEAVIVETLKWQGIASPEGANSVKEEDITMMKRELEELHDALERRNEKYDREKSKHSELLEKLEKTTLRMNRLQVMLERPCPHKRTNYNYEDTNNDRSLEQWRQSTQERLASIHQQVRNLTSHNGPPLPLYNAPRAPTSPMSMSYYNPNIVDNSSQNMPIPFDLPEAVRVESNHYVNVALAQMNRVLESNCNLLQHTKQISQGSHK